MASDTTSGIGCSDFESKTWDAVNRYLIEQNSIPTASELKDHMKLSLKGLKATGETLSEEQLNTLAQSFGELFEVLLTEAPQAEKTMEKIEDAHALLVLLSALELGDRTTDSKVKLQSRVENQFAKIQNYVAAMGVQCADPSPNPDDTVTEVEPGPTVHTSLPLPVYGIRFTFATAYQTCQALDEPVMSGSTSEIDSDAIKVTGPHSDGIGSKRIITNVTSLLRSHPYYKNVNNYGSRCLKGSSYPMIYDYGGKPYAMTGSSSPLNLFKNAGGGTSVLGVDCSGFIYTGLATAGLRLSPNKNMKASGVNGISSRMYLEPQKNGMGCLAKITLTPKSDLTAGDIIAVPGHVLMVDSVGSDPFGIHGVKSADDCSKLAARNFNFIVIQSSPSKNAVGMNRYQARDYLYETDKVRAGLEKYAYYACLAKINNKSYTPSLGTLSVIRHKMTPTCLGTRIKLTQESCVEGCTQLK